jgi:hypothetical protein
VFVPDYQIKLKTKEESTEFLKERLLELIRNGKEKSKECIFIQAILRIKR